MKNSIIILCLCSLQYANAQIISGRLVDEKKSAASSATIQLLRKNDSVLLKTATSNNNGFFSIEDNTGGKKILCITAVGYRPLFVSTDSLPAELQLQKKDASMTAVTITAKKPLIEIRPDKLIFNVEASINAAGSNAMELLQKSPGVIIDKDDNIILNGKTGIQLYIDGKPSPLTGINLSNYLRSMNSNDIEAIEIITNPSARYEAQGTAGIINIRLKKNKNFGWNGNVTGGYGIGIYAKYNTGLSLNYRNKKVNFFSNYSTSDNRNESQLNLHRLQNDTTYDQHSTTFSHSTGHNLKLGTDVSLSSKSTLGISLNGTTGNTAYNTYSITPIAAASTKENNRILTADGNSYAKRKNLSSNINYRYTDTSGRQFSLDLDQGYYELKSNGLTPNIYTDVPTGNPISSYTFGTITPTHINLLSVKADYSQNLKGGNLSVGFKSSSVKTDNDFAFYNYDSGNHPVYDNSRSNHFIYQEWVNAIFGLYQKKYKQFDYQFGLRLEQTNSEGTLRSADTVTGKNVKRNYLDFFPSAGINWQVNKNNSIGLSYSRRLDRPRYQDLNPFESKIDELSYRKGNPFLNPQYTNSYELRYVHKYTLTTSLSYSDVHDFFAEISDTIEGKRSYIMQRNLASQKTLSLNISYPLSIIKWWTAYVNISVYHTRYNATFEQGKSIKLNASVFSIYQQQTFSLGRKWTAEISGFYNSPSVWAGTYKSKAIWTVDAGLQKKFWNDNASIKASLSDIFKTMPWSGTSGFGGLYIVASGQWESRQAKINFTYRFGNKKVKAAMQRNTGIEELKSRVN